MEKKFIRFVLAKEDADLICWKNSLPPRSFNEIISKILVSESEGQIARIPCTFSSSEVAEGIDASFYVGDENVIALLGSIKRGQCTDTIKGIIRKHIKHNLEHPPEVVSVDLLYDILVDFRRKMAAKEAVYAGAENKYRKLQSTYDSGMRELFREILFCYMSGDEKVGDQHMRKLDVDRIVTHSFGWTFGMHWVSIKDEAV